MTSPCVLNIRTSLRPTKTVCGLSVEVNAQRQALPSGCAIGTIRSLEVISTGAPPGPGPSSVT